MNRRDDLDAETVRSALHYDPITGEWTWSNPTGPRVKPLARAGSYTGAGRRAIQIHGKSYLAARLAFLYMLGRWPEGDVDHINLDKRDDRWCNLRDVTHSQNMINSNKSRPKNRLPRGVYPVTEGGRYFSHICVGGEPKYLGSYDTPEAAHRAYQEAAKARGERMP